MPPTVVNRTAITGVPWMKAKGELIWPALFDVAVDKAVEAALATELAKLVASLAIEPATLVASVASETAPLVTSLATDAAPAVATV